MPAHAPTERESLRRRSVALRLKRDRRHVRTGELAALFGLETLSAALVPFRSRGAEALSF